MIERQANRKARLPGGNGRGAGRAPAIGCASLGFIVSKASSGMNVDQFINGRAMCIPLEQLRTVPLRVIASGRQEKVEALLGALNLVNCNVPITNEAAAREQLLRRS